MLCASDPGSQDPTLSDTLHLVHLYHSFFVAVCIGTISDTTVTLTLVGVDAVIKFMDFCLTLWWNKKVNTWHLTLDT